ncbi:Uncharacterised protein [Vibrio cholerae]|nr:Uncharacterised protein [Vibrio cholerae]CSI54136.1 Uncharacterised protein [Vibrio cholerae]
MYAPFVAFSPFGIHHKRSKPSTWSIRKAPQCFMLARSNLMYASYAVA